MVYRIAALAMVKPSFTTRADIHHHQSMASDLSVTQRTTSCRVSSTRRGDLVFIVNPKGANGRTGEDWKKLLPYLRSRLGKDRNICECLTSGPSHAIDITREAIREGADAVVAVGGDGTLHEVVNGFFWAGKPVCANDQESSHTTALGMMWSFLDRLINLGFPRTRDFQGTNPNSFDGHGNYSIGMKDQSVFPEIRYDFGGKSKGMDVCITTTANTDKEAQKLLALMGMPFREGGGPTVLIRKKKKKAHHFDTKSKRR